MCIITCVFLVWHKYFFLQMPMKFEVSFKNLVTICVVSHLWLHMYSCLADIFGFFSYMAITMEIVHTYVYTMLIPVNDEWKLQILYNWQPYFFFHIYDHLSIACLAKIFGFFLSTKFYVRVTNIWQPYLFFHICDCFSIPSLAHIFVFFSHFCQ